MYIVRWLFNVSFVWRCIKWLLSFIARTYAHPSAVLSRSRWHQAIYGFLNRSRSCGETLCGMAHLNYTVGVSLISNHCHQYEPVTNRNGSYYSYPICGVLTISPPDIRVMARYRKNGISNLGISGFFQSRNSDIYNAPIPGFRDCYFHWKLWLLNYSFCFVHHLARYGTCPVDTVGVAWTTVYSVKARASHWTDLHVGTIRYYHTT